MAGTVIGILVGRHVGHQMEQADQQCTGQVLERAADGQRVQWRNPDTRQVYAVTPARTRERNGEYCREYLTRATVGGQTREVRGTACRQEDGRWTMTNQGA